MGDEQTTINGAPEPIRAPEERHEPMRLFEPGPEPIPGQLALGAAVSPDAIAAARDDGRPASYRERQARKAERLRGWADGREAKADAAYAAFRGVLDAIPFGQPILVGHHSERGHRAALARAHGAVDRFSELNGKAAEMRQRADGIEAGARQSIYSGDPDAVERLREKLATLEARRESINAKNAAYRKAHRAELAALGSAFARDRALPHPGYELRNLGGVITSTRKRLAELETPETGRWLEARYAGECRGCGVDIAKGDRIRYYRRSREVECETCATAT